MNLFIIKGLVINILLWEYHLKLLLKWTQILIYLSKFFRDGWKALWIFASCPLGIPPTMVSVPKCRQLAPRLITIPLVFLCCYNIYQHLSLFLNATNQSVPPCTKQATITRYCPAYMKKKLTTCVCFGNWCVPAIINVFFFQGCINDFTHYFGITK